MADQDQVTEQAQMANQAQASGNSILQNIGRLFGITDQTNLSLWKETLLRRSRCFDVGISFGNAFGFCLGLKSKLTGKDSDGKSEAVNTKNQTLSVENEKEMRYQEATQFYQNLQEIEERTPPDAIGSSLPVYKTVEIHDIAADMVNSEEAKKTKRIWYKVVKKVKPMPSQFPWFMMVISLIQLITCIVQCSVGGIETIGTEPIVQLIPDVTTFRGSEQVDVWVRPNIWIGPPVAKFIEWGAVFSPCMRTDSTVQAILLSGNYHTDQHLGCCTVKRHDIAATTSEEECKNATLAGGTWVDQVCSKSVIPVKHFFRPCCFGLLGNCKMTTRTGCEAQGGHFHAEGPEHCSQVFCFPHFCGSLGLNPSKELKFMPASMNQGWRFLVSIIYPAGILHMFFTIFVQWSLGRPIEAMVGSWRMAIVYLYSAVGGLLVGGFMEPYLPHVGNGGAVFCLLSIALVEVLQERDRINFKTELVFLILLALIIVAFGFTPLVSNFVHLGGVFFGLPMAFLFMPHLNFNFWTCYARKIIVGLSVIIVILILLLFLLLFYLIQDTGACSGCFYFSCIPFPGHMCNILTELIGSLHSWDV